MLSIFPNVIEKSERTVVVHGLAVLLHLFPMELATELLLRISSLLLKERVLLSSMLLCSIMIFDLNQLRNQKYDLERCTRYVPCIGVYCQSGSTRTLVRIPNTY